MLKYQLVAQLIYWSLALIAINFVPKPYILPVCLVLGFIAPFIAFKFLGKKL